MCKEIKRLTLLSKCTHLSKTDRDACTWAIQQIEPPIVEPEKGFDGFDFSSWPELPSQERFAELILSRKEKHRIIMTQSYIDSAAPHMHKLKEKNIGVNTAVSIAAKNGWQGFLSKWVINAIEEESEPAGEEEITIHNVMPKIMSGAITSIAAVPVPVRKELESMVRFCRIKKPASLDALAKIGFAL
jgi:hypothetical protein